MDEQQTTNNIKIPNKNLEKLKKDFPQCFDKNGNFDFEKFKKELLKNEIDFSKESYGMDWLGKSYARLLASDEATTLLKENEEWNKKDENKNSQNLLLKGDNLEVLKHLSNAYYEKIKMIYIDPPYNTGSDGFVYQDDRKFTVEELSKLAGIDEEKAKRILDFVNSKSNSHSAWLTFMYPRLYIARQLLRDDGVIFVSIDDNEVAQLRILMDEIFGEENFVAQLTIETGEVFGTKASHADKTFIKVKDYVLVYSKNNLFSEKKQPLYDSMRELYDSHYNIILDNNLNKVSFIDFLKENKDVVKLFNKFGIKIDSNGINKVMNLDEVFKNYVYTLAENLYADAPLTKKIDGKILKKYKPGEPFIFEDKIVFKTKNETIRMFLSFKDNLKLSDDYEPVYSRCSIRGDLWKGFHFDMRNIQDEGSVDFKNGKKPVRLIKQLAKWMNDKEAIILDFFAGSGTTGDAVMQLNAEDGGNRKYILVQLPEPIDEKKNKTAYDFVKNELKVENPTIFEITKERLIRASKKIKEETIKQKIKEKEEEIKKLKQQLQTDETKEKIKQLKKEIENLKNQDLGFKIFETTPIWEDYNFKAEEFDPQQKLFDESKLSDEDIKTLLTTWKTYDGIPLTEDLKEIDLNGYKGYYFGTKLYLMHKGFETKNLKKLLEEIDENQDFNPATIIVFGYNFESKILREISENVKNYANKKQIDIDFIIRY